MANEVAVTITADASQARKEIDSSTKQLDQFARNINVFNKTAVKAFRESAQAERDLNLSIGASSEQMARLDNVTRNFEQRVETAGQKMTTAFERGSRGLSVMARQGDVTARSMNQIIASGADIAFAFGPEGAIISGVLMVTAGIVAHFESAEDKIEETLRKFQHSTDVMLRDGSAISAAKQAADSYVTELEAIAKQTRDAQANAGKSIMSMDLVSWWRQRGDSKDVTATSTTAAQEAQTAKVLKFIEADDKPLENLSNERKRINSDIAQLEAKALSLKGSNKTHELAQVNKDLGDARKELAAAEARTRALESDRTKRFSQMEGHSDDLTEKILREREQGLTTADFGAEHSDRETGVSREGRSRREALASQQDSLDKQRRTDRITAERRANDLLAQINDDAVQHELLARGLVEQAKEAAVQKDFDRRKQEIATLKAFHIDTTALEVALERDRIAQIEAIREEARQRELEQQVRASEEKRRNDDKDTAVIRNAEKKKADLIMGVEKGVVGALVAGHKKMGQEVLRALLEPEVKHLEALATKHFVMSGADFAVGNVVGGAKEAAAGALYTAGAVAVGEFANIGGGGGKSGGGGGGGGFGAGVSLGTQGSARNEPIKVEVVFVKQDTTGREVSRISQMMQRNEDKNQPVRVAL